MKIKAEKSRERSQKKKLYLTQKNHEIIRKSQENSHKKIKKQLRKIQEKIK